MVLNELTYVAEGLLVEIKDSESTTSSGFIIAGANDNDSLKCGLVINGPVYNGKEVWFFRHAGVNVRIEGKEHRLIKESDIVFINNNNKV